jgi:short-subunit dehydrogenase involved in D-alanine esterification of teichoic acids
MDLGLDGRTALVTGGRKGIGLAIAERLLREGGKVMVCGRDEKQLERVRADLSEYGQVGVGWADPEKERAEPLTLRPR